MTIRSIAAIFILVNASGIIARASGCVGYEKFVLGPKSALLTIEGKFFCSMSLTPAWKLCRFESNNLPAFISDYVRSDRAPVENTSLSVPVDVYEEAMEWLDCDGGDSEPTYSPNGTYYQFEYDGLKFSFFRPRGVVKPSTKTAIEFK